jgi:hypothetical protein
LAQARLSQAGSDLEHGGGPILGGYCECW